MNYAELTLHQAGLQARRPNRYHYSSADIIRRPFCGAGSMATRSLASGLGGWVAGAPPLQTRARRPPGSKGKPVPNALGLLVAYLYKTLQGESACSLGTNTSRQSPTPS